MGGGQNGHVVETVSDHGHPVALLLPSLELIELGLGAQAALHLVWAQAQTLGHGRHGAGAVARQHPNLQTHGFQCAQGLGGIRAQGFADFKTGQPTCLAPQMHTRRHGLLGRGLG